MYDFRAHNLQELIDIKDAIETLVFYGHGMPDMLRAVNREIERKKNIELKPFNSRQ